MTPPPPPSSPRTTSAPRRARLLGALLLLALITAGIGVALGTTQTGSRDFAFIASSENAVYSPISPFWLTWSHPVGLALLALGSGTTGATVIALIKPRH